ncbi:MAG: hypothetical protein K2O45_03435 [Oscillospiraceae bacterium]|nr:hypothetical protein [Oscillospiraceae bacterium]
MKKIIWMLLLCALFCALTACGEKEPSAPPAQPDVVSPEPPAGPDLPPEAPSPDESPAKPEVQPEEPSIPTTAWSGMLAAYQEVLEEIYQSSQDPEQSQYENGPSFALYDADRDGVEELIVRNTGGSMADMWTRVYGYNEASQTAYIELEEFSSLYWYDNGIIEAAWSHNQGMAGDKLWPYNVYQYSAETGKYELTAAVDGWDKSLSDTWSGTSFPDDVDMDGDGFVYYVITEEGSYAPDYGEVMDNADYEAWREMNLQGAFPTGPDLVPLTKENIALMQ